MAAFAASLTVHQALQSRPCQQQQQVSGGAAGEGQPSGRPAGRWVTSFGLSFDRVQVQGHATRINAKTGIFWVKEGPASIKVVAKSVWDMCGAWLQDGTMVHVLGPLGVTTAGRPPTSGGPALSAAGSDQGTDTTNTAGPQSGVSVQAGAAALNGNTSSRAAGDGLRPLGGHIPSTPTSAPVTQHTAPAHDNAAPSVAVVAAARAAPGTTSAKPPVPFIKAHKVLRLCGSSLPTPSLGMQQQYPDTALQGLSNTAGQWTAGMGAPCLQDPLPQGHSFATAAQGGAGMAAEAAGRVQGAGTHGADQDGCQGETQGEQEELAVLWAEHSKWLQEQVYPHFVAGQLAGSALPAAVGMQAG